MLEDGYIDTAGLSRQDAMISDLIAIFQPGLTQTVFEGRLYVHGSLISVPSSCPGFGFAAGALFKKVHLKKEVL